MCQCTANLFAGEVQVVCVENEHLVGIGIGVGFLGNFVRRGEIAQDGAAYAAREEEVNMRVIINARCPFAAEECPVSGIYLFTKFTAKTVDVVWW